MRMPSMRRSGNGKDVGESSRGNASYALVKTQQSNSGKLIGSIQRTRTTTTHFYPGIEAYHRGKMPEYPTLDHSGAWIAENGNRHFYVFGDPYDQYYRTHYGTIRKSFNHTPHDGYEAMRLKWPRLFEQRCELEAECRWNGIPVPKARSIELQRTDPSNVPALCERLERETMQMQKRLWRYWLLRPDKPGVPRDPAHVKSVLEDPRWVEDPDLSDYSNASDSGESE